jgi:hypothetical protein
MRTRVLAVLLVAFPVGLFLGVLAGPGLGSPPPAEVTLTHAQVAGGLGLVLPPAGTATAEAPPVLPVTPVDPKVYALMQERAGQAQPLVQGLQSNPNALLGLMRSLRDDPTLRQQALDRMRSTGGALGVGSSALTDQALQSTLDTLLADPQRLQGILGVLSSNPQLLGGMLGTMGLPNVTNDEINQVLGQLGNNPAALQGLIQGDQRTVDQLAEGVAAGQSGGAAPAPGGTTDIGGMLQTLQASQNAQSAGGQGGLQGLQGLQGLLGGGGGGGNNLDGAFASQLLGTGASLNLLADMLGIFGGGAQMTELQESLRSGDIGALLQMVQSFYGPNGSLSQELGVDVNSYTDLLDTLMTDQE